MLYATASRRRENVRPDAAPLGAAVDIANNHGATPLSHALVRGHASTAKLLLAAGANPALGPGGGGGALHALLGGSLSGAKLAKMVRTMLAPAAGLAVYLLSGADALAFWLTLLAVAAAMLAGETIAVAKMFAPATPGREAVA